MPRANPAKHYSDWSGRPTGPSTPWGRADVVYPIARGVRWVGTPGHGGLGVAKGVAARSLSAAALSLGERYGGYVWYEEDVAANIPFYEHPEWYETWAREAGGTVTSREQLEESIRRYYPQYFAGGHAANARRTHGVEWRAELDEIRGPGIPLYVPVLVSPDGTVYRHRAIKDHREALSIARHFAKGLNDPHTSVILHGSQWKPEARPEQRKNAARLHLWLGDDTLGQIMDMDAERLGFGSRDLMISITPEVERAVADYEWAMKTALQQWARKNMGEAEADALVSQLIAADASYLVLMTLRGEGVGIWDGSWDEYMPEAALKDLQAHLKKTLRGYAEDTGTGSVHDAINEEIYRAAEEAGIEPEP